ncbi:MAG: HAMP domain-containing histidine kinase, partial [Candidatus Rokubacteria bacterium]|nr:HAMP domain-containing histidine kinase [Candidatus Rokubacteria bacterium]
RQTRAFEPVDLRQVVREAVELTEGRWKDAAQVRGVSYQIVTDLAEVPAVAGEAGELREVLTNLLLNAFDAMPDGGTLHLGVRATDSAVVVVVRDTGSGMPPDVRERVFEPFFTTKGPRSTGLGLSVAYGIIERHRGRIEAESGAGHRRRARHPRRAGGHPGLGRPRGNGGRGWPGGPQDPRPARDVRPGVHRPRPPRDVRLGGRRPRPRGASRPPARPDHRLGRPARPSSPGTERHLAGDRQAVPGRAGAGGRGGRGEDAGADRARVDPRRGASPPFRNLPPGGIARAKPALGALR